MDNRKDGTASALRRIRFFTQAVTFTSSESDGYIAPTLNDIYENEVNRNKVPCNRLEQIEFKEPTPSQLVIEACFTRSSTERTRVAVPGGNGRKDTRKKRFTTVKEKGEKKLNFDILRPDTNQKFNGNPKRQQELDMNIPVPSMTAQLPPIEGLNQDSPQRYHQAKEMRLQGIVNRKILEGSISDENTKNDLSKMMKIIEFQPTLNSTVGNKQDIRLQNTPLSKKDKHASEYRGMTEAENAMGRIDTGRAIIIVRQAHKKLATDERSTVTPNNEEETNERNSVARMKAGAIDDSTVIRHQKNSGENARRRFSDEHTRQDYSNNGYIEGQQIPSVYDNGFPRDFEVEKDGGEPPKYQTIDLLPKNELTSHVTCQTDKDCQKNQSKIHIGLGELCNSSNVESIISTTGKLREKSSGMCSKEDEKVLDVSNDNHEKKLSPSTAHLGKRENLKYATHACNSAKFSESNNYLQENDAESINNIKKSNENTTHCSTIDVQNKSKSKDNGPLYLIVRSQNLAGTASVSDSGGPSKSIDCYEERQHSIEKPKLDICKAEFSGEEATSLHTDEDYISSTNVNSWRLQKGDTTQSVAKYQSTGAIRYSSDTIVKPTQTISTSGNQMHTASCLSSQVTRLENDTKASKMEPCEAHTGDQVVVHTRSNQPRELIQSGANGSRYSTRTSKTKQITGKRPPEILAKKRRTSH